MEKEKFSFRQRWFPTFDDADEIDVASKHSPGLAMQLFGRWARSIFLILALGIGGYKLIGNNIEYSEGERVGVVNKISEKGLIWKTKEGQLSLEGRTSTGEQTGAGVWDFSIDRLAKHGEDVNKIYSQINQYMENGERVKITYKQPLAIWKWRAKTKYLVQEITPVPLKNK